MDTQTSTPQPPVIDGIKLTMNETNTKEVTMTASRRLRIIRQFASQVLDLREVQWYDWPARTTRDPALFWVDYGQVFFYLPGATAEAVVCAWNPYANDGDALRLLEACLRKVKNLHLEHTREGRVRLNHIWSVTDTDKLRDAVCAFACQLLTNEADDPAQARSF